MVDAKDDLSLPADFDKLGHRARIIDLQNIAHRFSETSLFFTARRPKTNIPEQARPALPSAVSGVGWYIAFVSLLGIDPPRPTADGVARWIAVYSLGGNFLFTVSTSLRHSASSSLTPGVMMSFSPSIGAFVTNRQGNLNSTIPHVPQLLDRLIRFGSRGSEFARLCYVTYLFILRPHRKLYCYKSPAK